jgi:hypothetical protein
MQNMKIASVLFLVYASIMLLSGCYKDETVIIETGEEVTREVSFAQDLIPIFNSSCNSSGCHNAGGKAPDLSAVNAYSSLTNGGYINTSSPEYSELYLWMTGKNGTPMPPSGIDPDYNSLVLAWIKQGAKNN